MYLCFYEAFVRLHSVAFAAVAAAVSVAALVVMHLLWPSVSLHSPLEV